MTELAENPHIHSTCYGTCFECEAEKAFEKACLAQDPISRRAERKRIAGWLDEPCKWHEHGLGDHPIDRILRTPKIVKRRCCEECWEELVDELEEVSGGG